MLVSVSRQISEMYNFYLETGNYRMLAIRVIGNV